MSKLSTILSFVIGASIGAAATWYITKDKYEKIATEEINSTREVYRNKIKELAEDAPVTEKEIRSEANKPDISKYANLIEQKSYSHSEDERAVRPQKTRYSESFAEQTPIDDDDVPVDEPEEKDNSSEVYLEPVNNEISSNIGKLYSISPDSVGEVAGYDYVELLYFEDGFVTDDAFDEVKNIDETIGEDFFKYIGKYEEDVAYIRNDVTQCDYEIRKDRRYYTDIV